MAAKDPYQVLGVARTAGEDEIRSAYRKLAKRHHPDLNPGDKAAEERFKEASAAHALLSDTEQRARYDRGEIDAAGQERQPEHASYRSYAEGGQGPRYRPGAAGAGATGAYAGFDPEDLGDIFADLFGQGQGQGRGQGRGGAGPRQGRDEHYRLELDFLDAVNGGTQRLTLPTGKTLEVRVPAGIEEGQILRLRGQGGAAGPDGKAGDALIEIGIRPHAIFRREGNDIQLEVPVTYSEAVLGGKITVPTPGGPVSVTVPRHSDSGTRLRLRGRGVPAHGGRAAGDAYVSLRIVRGEVDQRLEDFLREWSSEHPFNPRQDMVD